MSYKKIAISSFPEIENTAKKLRESCKKFHAEMSKLEKLTEAIMEEAHKDSVLLWSELSNFLLESGLITSSDSIALSECGNFLEINISSQRAEEITTNIDSMLNQIFEDEYKKELH